MPPRVSILIPCWNAADTLPDCLDSILEQTFQDWELIAVNDGSTDKTAEVLDDYANRDERIRAMHLPKVGIVEAPMRAVGELTGEYLARMDADDVCAPERIAKQVALLDDKPNLTLCGTGVWHLGLEAGEGRRRYFDWINSLVDHEILMRELFVECPIANPTLMIRREQFDLIGGYQDNGWAEDYDLILRCAIAGYHMENVPEPLLGWRHSDGRATMTNDRYSLTRFRALKQHYLGSLYPQMNDGFYQWGAGDVGKTWLKEWQNESPQAVVDINPRKIGKVIHGCTVIEPDELPSPGEGFTVVAVGAPGAREEIREWFQSRGYCERRDFVFLA